MSALRWQGVVELALFLFAVAFLTVLVSGCKPETVRPAAYGAELAACSESAKTCEESIVCENKVRARYQRPLRTGGCQ
jgi:hypothetical protein